MRMWRLGILIGLALLAAASATAVSTERFIRAASRADGIVVAGARSGSSRCLA